MKAISLFSGMGGDTLGMEMAGIDVVAYSEINKIFRETHMLNFPESKLIGNGDIRKTPDECFLKYKNTINLIFAGFPCQGFSQAGKKLPEDPRNTLFREFLRATKLVEPDFIIGENVKGLLKRKNEKGAFFIDIIKEEFRMLGFNIYTHVLKASHFDIPQKRERLFIVGIKADIDNRFAFPEGDSDTNNLRDIVKFTMKGALKITSNAVFDMETVPNECLLKDMNNDDIEHTADSDVKLKPHPNLISLARDRTYTYKDVGYPRRLHFGRRIPVGGEVIDLRKSLNTVICTYARLPRFFVPQQNKNGYYLRALLPDELKQIQGFPKEFRIAGSETEQIVQIGNAVPPPLVYEVVRTICDSQLNS